jgi:multidrug resistance protein, MATE family
VLRAELKPTLRLAIPVILAELGWMGMGIVDTIMVAPLGPEAIAATGVGNSLHLGFAIFGMGLLLGLDTLVSQAYGAGNLRWAGVAGPRHRTRPGDHRAAGGPGGGVVGHSVLRLPWRHPPAAQRATSASSSSARRSCCCTRRSGGFCRPRITSDPVMFALVSANVINALANWTFIFGHFGVAPMGVPGAAWATFVSRVYMCTLLGLGGVVGDSRAASRDATTPPASAPPIVTGGVSIRRLVELGFPAASTVTAEVGVFAWQRRWPAGSSRWRPPRTRLRSTSPPWRS